MSATQEFVDHIMETKITSFAHLFGEKYKRKGDGLKNLINKANNPFILALGEEIVVYSALMRSLDSSLGNCLEAIARDIAEASYQVFTEVQGDVPTGIDQQINNLMEAYQSKKRKPKSADLNEIIIPKELIKGTESKTHKSDYHLIKRSDETQHFLLELKIGGDLDNKKARSEKQALLEQYAILKYSPLVRADSVIKIYFATAYNKFGEEVIWKQGRVGQFFGDDELLIGRDFWNFICETNEGYQMVINGYNKHAYHIKEALEGIISDAKSASTHQLKLI